MPESTSTKVGHALAKVLGIKLHYRDPTGTAEISRGESAYSVSTADTYVEEEPTSLEWLREITPSGEDVLHYLIHLLPFIHWIGRYNLQWFTGDLVAGITVGAVVVPQSMAYAVLANLPVQFGLYSSFMGVLIYWFFATSKDITIGPVAVLSTVTGNVVATSAAALPGVAPNAIASALAIVAGAIVCFIGLIRFGWIVDVISLAAISAFMTGSALNIAVGQVPSLLGISSTVVNSRDATYLVVINVLKHLNACKLDAAMGLTAMAMLYIIRSACKYAAKKHPRRAKLWFFLSTLRTAFVILLYTMISWLVNMNHRSKPKFKILGSVPRGFQDAGVPTVTLDIIRSFAGQLPATVIVMLIEHIAIAKSFGRVNNYTIDPSQEMVAIGVTNLLGPFLGAYPATGSFSRTAIKSKAGVRTPFGGLITALVVLLAIYALPAVFFYIPNSSLSGVIIHAVGDLITAPNTVYQFWRISPLEVIIFFAGVFVTVFSSIENGIYTTIVVSICVFLFRAFKARGRFLGKVKIHSVLGDHIMDQDGKNGASTGVQPSNDPDNSVRNIFLPITHGDGSNPQVEIDRPYPGIFIYRFSEGFNYPNANHYLDHLVKVIFAETRRTNQSSYARPGDRPWNDPGPRRGQAEADHSDKPELKAIILDFSSVNNVDITSVQLLIDIRNQLDRYTSPNRVDWHFAHINNRWTKRALTSAGFGYPSPRDADEPFQRWKPIFSVAEIGGAAASAETELERQRSKERSTVRSKSNTGDHIAADAASASSASEEFSKDISHSKAYAKDGQRVALVHGVNRPLFHIDLTSALQSAIVNCERRTDAEPRGVGTADV